MGSSGQDRHGQQHQSELSEETKRHLHVTAVDDAPELLVELGLAYWQLAEIDEMGVPRWSRSTSQLDTHGLGAIHHVAAASVRAVAAGASCNRCGKPLTVRTRSDFGHVLAGGSANCLLCDPKYTDAAAKVISAFSSGRHQQAIAAHEAREAERAWNALRRQEIDTKHAVRLTPEIPIPKVRLDLAVTLLSILRQGPASATVPGLITSIGLWRTPLAATSNTSTLVNEINGAGLIKTHPSTDVRAFIFEPASYAGALAAADGIAGDVAPPRLTNHYYPLDTCFYIPYGPSIGTAVPRMDEYLVDRLQLDALDESDRLKLLALHADTVADETVRYFEFQIEDKRLPPVPEQHLPRLREAAHKAAEYMSLGRLYCQAWRAARDAAVVAQRRQMPNSPNMTTFGVNKFEQYVADRAQAEGDPFREDVNLPLAAVTRTLFRTVLDVEPMNCTVDQTRALLAAVPLPDDGSWSWDAAAEDVAKSIELGIWSGDVLRHELTRMHTHWGRVQALAAQTRIAQKLIEHYDVYVTSRGPRGAALVTLELATLTARASADDAAAAQAVLLWWGDALVEHQAASALQVSAVDVESVDESDAVEVAVPSQHDEAPSSQQAGANKSPVQKKSRSSSRKKKRRR